ncbi:MAG TPA: phenylacetate--CoA ligase family protein, partial [Actinomycetota bacterium]|nr:phenylacetate--CoA ligase family protein [Actinomycetota bacterium]
GALAGYPSIIETLAEEVMAGRLKIRPVAVICSAEVLTPDARSLIESAFNAPVFDEYNATEFAPIALRRPCGWMHVNADWVIVEPVEADLSPTPAGRPSHGLLLTNLANRIQPLIRCQLGDQVTVRPDPCPCGSPLPAIRVEGRTSDRVQFQDPQGKAVVLLGMNLYTIFLDVPGVASGQALQTGDNELQIRLGYRRGFNPVEAREQVLGMVTKLLAGNNLANVAVTLSEEPPARDAGSQKYRVLWDARPGSLEP